MHMVSTGQGLSRGLQRGQPRLASLHSVHRSADGCSCVSASLPIAISMFCPRRNPPAAKCLARCLDDGCRPASRNTPRCIEPALEPTPMGPHYTAVRRLRGFLWCPLQGVVHLGKVGVWGGARTRYRRLIGPMLCQMSYPIGRGYRNRTCRAVYSTAAHR